MMRGAIRVVLALALVALASLTFALAPSEEQRQAPFEINVELGETGTGRNIVATVHAARLAESAETDSFDPWIGETTGVWLVLDATVSSAVNPTLVRSWLSIGDLRFDASTRPGSASLDNSVAAAGIPVSGSIAFEIPAELAESSTPVRITIAPTADSRLDSTIVLTLRLDELEVEPVAVLWDRKTGLP